MLICATMRSDSSLLMLDFAILGLALLLQSLSHLGSSLSSLDYTGLGSSLFPSQLRMFGCSVLGFLSHATRSLLSSL